MAGLPRHERQAKPARLRLPLAGHSQPSLPLPPYPPAQVAQAAAVQEWLQEHQDLSYLDWAYTADPTGARVVQML